MNTNIKTVDEYIDGFSGNTKDRLKRIRAIIQSSAPGAAESISYGMPAYKLSGKPLVYFAGYKNHIGFYATPAGHEAFAKALSKYKQGKGSVQFPLGEALPVGLITSMIKFRVKENLLKEKSGNKT